MTITLQPRMVHGRYGRGSKFGNKRTAIGEEVFDSKREAIRFQQLQLLQTAGRIRNLRRQVKYELRVNTVLISTYRADFVYEELDKGQWLEVVEDSKGYPNDRWPMKKKLMKAIHGVIIRES